MEQNLTLENCHREPIQSPGAIQSFGCLIATSRKLDRITHVSANCVAFFGKQPGEILGHEIEQIFTHELSHLLRNLAGRSTIETHRQITGPHQLYVNGESTAICLALHKSRNRMVIEIEPSRSSDDLITRIHDMGASFPDRTKGIQSISDRSITAPQAGAEDSLSLSTDVERILNQAVKSLRQQSGFDRVMVYQILANDDGEIVAEECASHLTPYLGRRSPTSDILGQVRDHEAQTPIRCVGDVFDEHVHLFCMDEDELPLDLSLTELQRASPRHLEILANIGVRSTMSVPIKIGKRLWGVFAFLHGEPCPLDLVARSAIAKGAKTVEADLAQMFLATNKDKRGDERGAPTSLFSIQRSALGCLTRKGGD